MIAQLDRARGRTRPVSQAFLGRMTAHLRKHFPYYCAKLGDRVTRQAVIEGIERALVYGITGDRAVCLFIDLLFAFGPTFDMEEEFAWAHGILQNPVLDPDTKMERLYATGLSLTRYHRCR